jgi:hypothetical protein
VPKGQPDPDIFITLEALGGGAGKVGLYCNPSWGAYADVNANYAQPGYAVWQSGARARGWAGLVGCAYLPDSLGSWGAYADVNANHPQPGYAVWQSGAGARRPRLGRLGRVRVAHVEAR